MQRGTQPSKLQEWHPNVSLMEHHLQGVGLSCLPSLTRVPLDLYKTAFKSWETLQRSIVYVRELQQKGGKTAKNASRPIA